jgi:ESS family glutamate:Na+ symporter
MELIDKNLHLDHFMTVTLGMVAVLIGKLLNEKISLLQRFTIPDSVTGGLLFAVSLAVLYAVSGYALEFDLYARDFLLVYFFTTIGINSNIGDLLAGGRPLVVLLAITVVYMLLQNVIGIGTAYLFDLHPATGLIGGTVSLIGGYGTSIAWSPRFAELGIPSAVEMGVACATFGLIIASLMGGPVAQHLIKKHDLVSVVGEPQDVGVAGAQNGGVSHIALFDSLLAIHLCMIVGFIMNEALEAMGIALPLFVTCLATGMVLSSIVSRFSPRSVAARWPSRTPATALIAEISLGAFLAMSLISLQLWTLSDLALPLFTMLALQVLAALATTLFVVFRLMGANYDAAIICAGFGGISLGSTPTAMANMAAVTQRFGASHLAFFVVPLVCAFFIDIVNAFMIPVLLSVIVG